MCAAVGTGAFLPPQATLSILPWVRAISAPRDRHVSLNSHSRWFAWVRAGVALPLKADDQAVPCDMDARQLVRRWLCSTR